MLMPTGKEKADMAAQKAKELLTPGQNYAIAIVGRNILNGAFWGFTSPEDVQEFASSISDNPNMRARRIGDSYLVEVKPSYIIDSLLTIDPELFNDDDSQRVREAFTAANIEFEKFLVGRGIAEEHYQGKIAIYCTNKTPSISHHDMHYPAFRLSIEQALKTLAKFAYEIKVGDTFLKPEDAALRYKELWDGLEVTPTKSGVFINIRATLTPDQYRDIRRQIKEKYNL